MGGGGSTAASGGGGGGWVEGQVPTRCLLHASYAAHPCTRATSTMCKTHTHTETKRKATKMRNNPVGSGEADVCLHARGHCHGLRRTRTSGATKKKTMSGGERRRRAVCDARRTSAGSAASEGPSRACGAGPAPHSHRLDPVLRCCAPYSRHASPLVYRSKTQSEGSAVGVGEGGGGGGEGRRTPHPARCTSHKKWMGTPGEGEMHKKEEGEHSAASSGINATRHGSWRMRTIRSHASAPTPALQPCRLLLR